MIILTCGGVWVVLMTPAPKHHTVLHTVLHITYLYVLKIHVELRIPLKKVLRTKTVKSALNIAVTLLTQMRSLTMTI